MGAFVLSFVLLLIPHIVMFVRCHHYSINITEVPSVTYTTTSSLTLTYTSDSGALGQSLTATHTPSSPVAVCAAGVASSTSHGALTAPVIVLGICLGILLFLLVCLSLFLFIRRRHRLRNAFVSTTTISNDPPTAGPVQTRTRLARVAPELTHNGALVLKTSSPSYLPPKRQSTQPHFPVSSQLDTECHCRGFTEAVARLPSKAERSGLELSLASSHAGSEESHVPSVSTALGIISPANENDHHPEILALVQETKLTKQAVAQMAPTKPREGQVLSGYNLTLDEKRPGEIREYLQKYHILFVIDDSGSMSGARWNETRDALSEIADHALNFRSETVDICLFNHTYQRSGLKGVQEVMNIFGLVRPSGGTPTGHVLEKILDEKIRRLDELEADQRGGYLSELPLDIIVLTDGVPAPVIDKAARRMKAKKHHPNWIGIQFVQIGNESAAEPTLISLIDSKEHDMVDTISYSMYREKGGGKLTSAVLEQIILGGLHPNLRVHWNRYRRQEAQNT